MPPLWRLDRSGLSVGPVEEMDMGRGDGTACLGPNYADGRVTLMFFRETEPRP